MMISDVQESLNVFLILNVSEDNFLDASHCTLIYSLLIALVMSLDFILTVSVVKLVKHIVLLDVFVS